MADLVVEQAVFEAAGRALSQAGVAIAGGRLVRAGELGPAEVRQAGQDVAVQWAQWGPDVSEKFGAGGQQVEAVARAFVQVDVALAGGAAGGSGPGSGEGSGEG